MSLANRFVTDCLYTLKRQFGQAVALYLRGTATQNEETGDVTYNETKWKIRRAPVLEMDVLRKFQYDLSFIAANKNFTYGGFYDKGQRGVIVDRKDLPTDFVGSLDDRFVIDHRRYSIKQITEVEQTRGFIFVIEELQSQKVNEIFDLLETMYLEETAEGVL